VAELNPSKSEVSSLAPNTEVSFLPMEAIGEDGSHQLDQVRLLSDVLTGYTFFKDGDVAIAKITPCFENGKGAVMRNLRNGIGFGTTELIVARPRAAATTSSFLHWLFSSHAFRQAGEAFMYGAGGQKRVPYDFVRNFATAFPPLPEQHQVVAFLDRETAKIDALVEEQKRLIELLKEKRQAVISQAVTKGLDPSVPMKDSGVAWLGEVPAHWTVCTLRRLIKKIEQGWSPECDAQPADEETWGVLKAGCVNRGVFNPEENKSLPESLTPVAEYEVRAGDVLMSRASGSPELVGSTALVGATRPRLMLSDKIFRVHLETGQEEGFFVWAMNAKYMREQIEQSLSGGNGLANNLPQSVLLSFYCAVPPEIDQIAIGQWLNREAARVDSLLAEASALIELLAERRSALISAAVTGKIDVRGLAPQPEVTAA